MTAGSPSSKSRASRRSPISNDDWRKPMAKSTYFYVSYIRTTPEKLWKALTDAEFIKQYWFGMRAESEWRPGSSWKLVASDGKVWDAGEIVEAVAPRRLVIRWQHQNKPELKAE